MELIPFLIFAVVAFNIFKGITKASSSKTNNSRNEALQRLRAQIEEAAQSENQNRYQTKRPTEYGRESFSREEQNSPWGDSVAPGARVAANYLKNSRAARKAAHKNPVQKGRRGKNMDQNRNRTDDWGQRGDSGILSLRSAVIFLALGGAVLYALSNMPAT